MNETTQLKPPLLPIPGGAGKILDWGKLQGASLALALAQGARHCVGVALVVTPDTPSATRLRIIPPCSAW